MFEDPFCGCPKGNWELDYHVALASCDRYATGVCSLVASIYKACGKRALSEWHELVWPSSKALRW